MMDKAIEIWYKLSSLIFHNLFLFHLLTANKHIFGTNLKDIYHVERINVSQHSKKKHFEPCS